MRDFKGMKRQRGRNRKPGQGGGNNHANATNPNRSWDSQGPENIKVRGNAQTVYERYMQLARDASAAGDRVLAENYTQHAEHYFRVLRALQPSRPVSEIAQRELAGQGFDIDFEDETGAQAAAIMAAEKAEADRVAAAEARQRDNEDRQNGERQNGGSYDRQNDRPNDRQAEQPRREWRDRDDQPRDQAPRAEGADGAAGEGGRRETRRERWERRQQERNLRFQNERGEGDQTDAAPTAEDAPAAGTPNHSSEAEPAAPKAERAPRARRPRRDESEAAVEEAPTALPGFLTGPTATTA
ncbi:MAG: DUF4167 domain-containing protein, partial [Alphaproteobacteria bacterium]|nr:DUF4167 domain-containing protein [Alphaproteobacteria bacterium]